MCSKCENIETPAGVQEDFILYFRLLKLTAEILLRVEYHLKFENKCSDAKSKSFILNETFQTEYMMFNKPVRKSY